MREANLILAGPDEPNLILFMSLSLLYDPPRDMGVAPWIVGVAKKVTWKPQWKLILWKSKVAFSQGQAFGVTAPCRRGRMQQNKNYLRFLKPEFCKTKVMRL